MATPLLDLTTDQRYYYMVILKIEGNNQQNYAKSYDDWVLITEVAVKSSTVIHLICNTDRSYHVGEQEIFNAEKNKNIKALNEIKSKKYLYDCLIINMVDCRLVCILAPFVELLEKLRSSFIKQFCISEKYLCLNIFNLVKGIITNELVTSDLTLKTTGIGISKSGSGDLSNVVLKGNKPLSTQIGELVFALLSQTDDKNDVVWYTSNCRIKSITGRSEISRINLSLNADKYGNYKLYLQKACLNILSLLALFEFVFTGNYFRYTETAPTSRTVEIE
jgi:hypothetical protein